jgi:hypothetical protein
MSSSALSSHSLRVNLSVPLVVFGIAPGDSSAMAWTGISCSLVGASRMQPTMSSVETLPAPGSPAEKRLEACKTRARAIAQSRPGTAFLDLQVDGPIARDPGNFADANHFRDKILPEIEPLIVRAAGEIAAP